MTCAQYEKVIGGSVLVPGGEAHFMPDELDIHVVQSPTSDSGRPSRGLLPKESTFMFGIRSQSNGAPLVDGSRDSDA